MRASQCARVCVQVGTNAFRRCLLNSEDISKKNGILSRRDARTWLIRTRASLSRACSHQVMAGMIKYSFANSSIDVDKLSGRTPTKILPGSSVRTKHFMPSQRTSRLTLYRNNLENPYSRLMNPYTRTGRTTIRLSSCDSHRAFHTNADVQISAVMFAAKLFVGTESPMSTSVNRDVGHFSRQVVVMAMVVPMDWMKTTNLQQSQCQMATNLLPPQTVEALQEIVADRYVQ